MSDRRPVASPAPHRRVRDAGISLPEVLIGMLLTSLLIVALSSALMVMLSQQDNTSGRLNNARSEQSVGLWMPADLASAETASDDPQALPCVAPCPATANIGGSNALMLTWESLAAGESSAVTTVTNVSYRYLLLGDEYVLVRVECTRVGGGADACSTATVLHDLPGPPDGVNWQPGDKPDWVIDISEPLDPSDPGVSGSTIAPESGVLVKNASRVIVTINGGGDAPGQGGGTNQITLSAGGTDLDDLEATSVAGTPSFTAARSRCGGAITLVVDESTSIGSTAMQQVEDAVYDFVETFTGTPVKLQIIGFSTKSDAVGTSEWSHYFDMLDDDAAKTLLDAIKPELASNGYTNWEDALFRTFYNEDGTVQSTLPDIVLFFTDGVPTRSRVTQSSSSTAPVTPPARLVGYPSETTTAYNQESFYRANVIAQEFRSSVRFIGVGVGPSVDPSVVTNTSDWITGVKGYHYTYERAFHYEKKVSGNWVVTDLAGYNGASASNRRIRYTSPWNVWEATDKAGYDAVTVAAGKRRTAVYSAPFDSYEHTIVAAPNATIITRLITGTDNGVNGISSGGKYTNADLANMYVLPDWAEFSGALQAVALAECGATLTMQTKVGGAPAADPFTYQNTAITSSSGATVPTDLSVVTTTRQFTSGTFDFDIPDGSYVTVEIQPQNLSDLVAYKPGDWTCRAGSSSKSFDTIPIPGSSWTGIRVQVHANEAVSCVQNVARV